MRVTRADCCLRAACTMRGMQTCNMHATSKPSYSSSLLQLTLAPGSVRKRTRFPSFQRFSLRLRLLGWHAECRSQGDWRSEEEPGLHGNSGSGGMLQRISSPPSQWRNSGKAGAGGLGGSAASG